MLSSMTAPAVFQISNWKPCPKRSLVGFFSIELPSGLVLHECSYHRKTADDRWVGLAARKYEKNGEVGYAPLVEFSSRESKRKFQEQAMAALDAFLGGGR
jgi:hypothetical protein